MYYPICYLMPNAGPCIKAANKPSAVAALSTTTLASASSLPTLSPTSLDSSRLAELEQKSVSSYKSMLRSVYSSQGKQSSLSEFWATAVPTQTDDEQESSYTSKQTESAELNNKQVDTSPMSVPQLMLVSVLACAGMVARVLY